MHEVCEHDQDITVVWSMTAGPRCPLCEAEAIIEKLKARVEELEAHIEGASEDIDAAVETLITEL